MLCATFYWEGQGQNDFEAAEDSDVESLQLRLGLPPLLDVLVKLFGHINGKEVILNATGSLTETGEAVKI